MATIYTIGFTQKPAERFFGLLREAGARRLLDIRLNPGGQLAGFAKQGDLAYFLRALADCDYRHVPSLAPTADILGDYRADHDWSRYVARFDALMDERNVPAILDRAELAATPSCCSAAKRRRSNVTAASWPSGSPAPGRNSRLCIWFRNRDSIPAPCPSRPALKTPG
jgi:uncharacterized protein DUF488